VIQYIHETFGLEFKEEIRNDFYSWKDDLETPSFEFTVDVWKHKQDLVYKPER
jgi:hypothetical protein